MNPETDDEALLNWEFKKSYIETSQIQISRRFLWTTFSISGAMIVTTFVLSKFNKDVTVFFAVTFLQALMAFLLYLSIWRCEKYRQRVVRRIHAISCEEMEYMELFRNSIEIMDAEYFRYDARKWYTLTQTKGT